MEHDLLACLGTASRFDLEQGRARACVLPALWVTCERAYTGTHTDAFHALARHGPVLRYRREDSYREGRGTRITAWAPKGEEPRPNPAKYTQEARLNTNKREPHETPTRNRLQTYPHRSAKATVKQATADNLRPPRPRDKRGYDTGPGRAPE
jgi:hypothetical protein